jgi:Xaa-Pro aminopeptidase
MLYEPTKLGLIDSDEAPRKTIAGVGEAEILRRKRPGLGVTDTEPLSLDVVALRGKRLARVRQWLRDSGYGGCVLLEPNHQRYATGSRNMFGYFLRNSTRYFFIGAQGPVILFEYPQSAHVSEVLETVDETRHSKIVWSSVLGKDDDTALPFAREIASLIAEYGGGSRRVGLDRCYLSLAQSLQKQGLEVSDCNQELLHLRRIKLPEEIACLTMSMINSEAAVAKVREAIRPGISEQELFATMYHEVIAGGGEMIETRLLSSGPRTNPWFNEASTKRVRPGELVALDTDTIGNFGYYSDFSRTFFCGPGRPSGEQKALYQMAYDQVHHNIDIIEPGMSYREVAEAAWKIPERLVERRYTSVMHGCGMHGETPFIAHAMDFGEFGGEGIIEPGMVLCIESYIGEVAGPEGVKLEEEVVVTETGVEKISHFPYEDELLR